jgi:pilus assembly protein Flp/PilA
LSGGRAGVTLSIQANANKGQSTTRKGVLLKVMNFIREEDGQGLVEYALIIAVIAIAVIVAMLFLRGQIQNIFSNIGNNLT